jgi:secreted PhoX family phosphatase
MQNSISRRNFMKTLGAVSLGFSGLQSFAKTGLFEATSVPHQLLKGYGKLVDKGILKLPASFSYQIIAERGTMMNDGLLLPGRGDGMGAFEGKDGKVILVRNHENSATDLVESPFGLKNKLWSTINPKSVFDNGFGKNPHLGGTTTSVYNEKTQQVEKVFMSLAGTARNCAGGMTPWGSWLTCEEYVCAKDDKNEQNHGYVFEVPASEKMRLKYPVPIRAMGRFNHEAVAVDPRTGIVYLTEDRGNGLFYRFIPKVKGALHKGGKLQALAFVWKSSMDTRNWETQKITPQTNYAVKWIDLKDIDTDADDLRIRGYAQGAAIFARGEGIWFGNNELYFACTSGGRIHTGQIFRYQPSPHEGTAKEREKKYYPRLELFAEPNDTKLLKYCDNLTIAPWGDIVFCEDGKMGTRIFGITPKGDFYQIAENIGFESEFAGVCFSPSGKTLFVNIQKPGLTLAITGDWTNT